jgi:4-diphosphocytidyl-2-C-methyl-D-erythritol kinase
MTLCLKSPAKINLYLHVGGLRPDGFHELQTIYQELALADLMRFDRISASDCLLKGFPADINPEINLVRRAWVAMRQHFGDSAVGGLSVDIEKHLPRGGGLGGGSSNAGVTLRAINMLYDLGASPEELEKIAAALGSDVPFFIRGGTAGGTGRGEIIQALPVPPSCPIVLYFPSEGVNTGEAYRTLDAMEPRPHSAVSYKEAIKFLQIPLQESSTRLIQNDFELAVQEAVWFAKAKEALENAGCIKVFLCGSGSTVAGIAKNIMQAEAITKEIGRQCTYTTTVTF